MGARGPKKGAKFQKTLDKEAARAVLREIVLKNMKPMVQRQIVASMGIGHLYTRDKSGKFTKIEDQRQADELLTKGEEGVNYWIFMKDPSTQAFTDLMNRAIDKPIEAVEVAHSGGITIKHEL